MSCRVAEAGNIAHAAHNVVLAVVLHVSSHDSIAELLQATQAHFFAIRLRVLSWMTWYVHMQLVGTDGVVIKPRAIAAFPFDATYHAKFCTATANIS